jgi:hypothetical protein
MRKTEFLFDDLLTNILHLVEDITTAKINKENINIFDKLPLTQKEKDYLFDGYVTGCLDVANKLKGIVDESIKLAKMLKQGPVDTIGNPISDTPPTK